MLTPTTVRRVVATALVVAAVMALAGRADAATSAPAPPPPKDRARSAPSEVVLGHLAPARGPLPVAARRAAPPLPSSGVPNLGATAGGGVRGSSEGHSAADDLKGAPGCVLQCITSGVAHARGAGARLRVTTDTPASIRVVVMHDDGYFRYLDSPDGASTFDAVFDDLEDDTTYDAVAYAVDGTGSTSVRSGPFTTLRRDVHLSFGDVTLHARPYGDDPFRVQAWLQGSFELEGYGATPWGDDLPLGFHTLARDGVDRWLEVQVELTQVEDTDDVCEAAVDPGVPESGPGDCVYHAYAEPWGGGIDLDVRPDGATSWTGWTYDTQLVLPGGLYPPGLASPLDFTIPVTVEVAFT